MRVYSWANGQAVQCPAEAWQYPERSRAGTAAQKHFWPKHFWPKRKHFWPMRKAKHFWSRLKHFWPKPHGQNIFGRNKRSTKMETERVYGKDLKVGDTIKVWWTPTRDTIVSLEPYRGPLGYLFPGGAQIAGFAVGPGLTIDNEDLYNRIGRRC
jgi:hypothetical protein